MTVLTRVFTLLVLLLLGSSCALLPRPYLVAEGLPNAEIVITADPPRTTTLAAEELQTHLEAITGAKLPIVQTPSSDEVARIYVGESDYTRALGLSTEGLRHGAYRLRSGDNWLALIGQDIDYQPPELRARGNADRERMQEEWQALTGGDWTNPVGTSIHRNYSHTMQLWNYDKGGSLHAVYAWLHDLGARWYMPGELGQILPRKASLELPIVDREVHPSFVLRDFYFGTYFSSPREDIMWKRQLMLNPAHDVVGVAGGLAHEMRALMNSETMKREHPEYYALWGGERKTEGGGKPCLSSEGLLQEHVRFVRAVFDTYDTPMLSIMPQDGYGSPCQCELCEGKETPDRGWHGSMSDYVFSYMNRVAEEVYKTHPDRKVSCFAYGSYLLPPTTIEHFSPNFVVGIVHGRNAKFRDPATREKVDEIRQGWAALTDNKLIMWEHYPFTHRNRFTPEYFPHKIAKGLQELEGISLGEFVEAPFGPFEQRGHGLHTPGFSHLNFYVTARLYWDPHVDLEAMLAEYYRLFYGPAAAEMEAFISYSEAHYQDMMHDVQKIDKVLDLLSQAEAKVKPDSPYGQRIAMVRDYLKPLEDLGQQLAFGRQDVPEARAHAAKASEYTLDGKLDDPLWARCHPLRLSELQTGREPATPTVFHLAWVDNDLVIAIRATEPDMANLNDQASEEETEKIWFGDCVEVLLETQSHAYYQIAVSPSGKVVDIDRQKGLNFNWSSNAEVATSRGDDYWAVEIRIPMVEGDMPDDPNHDVVGRRPRGDFSWYFNICRQRIRDTGSELTAFAPTGVAGFHKRMKFGKLYAR